MSLCLLVINHCRTLYRTDNARVPFSPLKINSSTSDVLTIAGQENEILLTQLQRKVQSECSMSGVFTGERGIESGNLSKKKKKMLLDVEKEWVLRKAWEHTLVHTQTHTHTNIRAQLMNNSSGLLRKIPFTSDSTVTPGFFFFCFVCY